MEGLVFNIPESAEFSLDWPLKILKVDEEQVVFQYMAENRTSTINTVFGPANIYGDGDDIVIDIQASAGQTIVTLNGPATVQSVNEENITIDFNHPLAGKTLSFWIKLVDLPKQEMDIGRVTPSRMPFFFFRYQPPSVICLPRPFISSS